MASADTDPTPASDTVYSFFYGTLMAPEVFYTVCYRLRSASAELSAQHPFQDALLHGYTRHRVQGQDYPGIIADDADGACVRGMLVGGITEDNLLRLDRFEGTEYVRRDVEVEVEADDGSAQKKTVPATVYVYKYPDHLERREWDFAEFRRDKMHKWARADLTFGGDE